MVSPIRFLSGRQNQQKIGIEGSTENQKVLEVVGRVGIGTTIFDADYNLDVRGDVSIEGPLIVDDLNVSGVSTFASDVDFNGNLDVDGQTDLDDLNVSGVSTFASDVDFNGNLDVDGQTDLDSLNVSIAATIANLTLANVGVAITAILDEDDLISDRDDALATQQSIKSYVDDQTREQDLDFAGDSGSGSIQLSSETFTIAGTANEIETVGSGQTLTIGLPNNPTLPGTTVTIANDLQVNRNLNVDGNITVGGTSATLFTETLKVSDSDIVLGFRTDDVGNDVSNDTTANHGGIAVASTEGSPLISLIGAGETLPTTYKKIMWFQSGSFTGLATDAWLTNYAFGVGTTSLSAGTKFAVGNIETNFDDITSVRNINASGIITAASFVGDGSNITGLTAGDVGALAGISIREEGSVVGSAGSVGDINFVSSNLTVTSSGVGATITLTDDPTFDGVTVTGVVTAASFVGDGSNIIGINSFAKELRQDADGNIFAGDSTTGGGYDSGTGTACFNIFMGCNAGNSITEGDFNFFAGCSAGQRNTTGSYNNFLGRCAGYSNTTGTSNNFLGLSAGRFNTTGSDNNFLGNYAGFLNTTGSYNNFFGHVQEDQHHWKL